jgi:hypothetical protein
MMRILFAGVHRIAMASWLAGLMIALGVGTTPALGQATKKEDLKKSATLEIDQVQVALFYSGNLGGGKLHYNGKTYDFTVGGLGIGGIGASKMEAIGQVYNLTKLEDFPGAYGQARYGFAAGSESAGAMWLQNPSGVLIELKTKREGLALSLGGDAVYIAFK